MSTPKRSAVEELEALIDAYLDDLDRVPGSDLLSDPERVKKQRSTFEELLNTATGEAGKRRLAIAKRALARKRESRPVQAVSVDRIEVRRYVAQAANDARITLAARDLNEMADEEVERIYWQLKELEAARSPKKE